MRCDAHRRLLWLVVGTVAFGAFPSSHPGRTSAVGVPISSRHCFVVNHQQPPGATSSPAAGRAGKIVIPAGIEIMAELTDDLDTRLISEGEEFTLRLTQAIFVGGREIIPRGTRVIGQATARQDEEGNYSTLVLSFGRLALGARSLPVSFAVKALEPPLPPPEGGTSPSGPPLPGESDRRPGELRRPRIEVSGGISIRRIPDTSTPGKPSKIGRRRESVELMKISQAETGETEIFLEGEDISLRPGTRFRLRLTEDLVVN
ncbi:MAG TPA: hypothetical protein VNM72_05495 [Blastocatellia bacterium]|nr:hypothetical protein [Blastocatellia bacterium]